MKSYEEWSEAQQPVEAVWGKQGEWVLFETDRRDEKKNSQGGLTPHNAAERKKHKHADLITLPTEIKGTNCGNCSYIKDVKKGVGYCTHPDLECYVTERMCCSYWNHDKVKRKF